jgi:hypothetical protein
MESTLRLNYPNQDDLGVEVELELELNGEAAAAWSGIDGDASIELRTIIAREGSALADLLRSRGWIVRSGWRSTTDTGASVWNLRFETPDDVELNLVDHSA